MTLALHYNETCELQCVMTFICIKTDENPHSLDGKVKRLPKSLSESVEALEKDGVLKDLIGEKLLVAIKGVRKAEVKYYSENKDAYKNLIHKY
ncbi:hypothetical protein RJ639_032167 [Escallonia herrerae]|uniref:GS catalytic domain-containing protein n=1 Tax=Escallonia herrerae TaxID=1293975 RepID=A0AA88X3S4_9ASTE|nr:hypothetical protein RJ639_032167 [Escallonia herrerae]